MCTVQLLCRYRQGGQSRYVSWLTPGNTAFNCCFPGPPADHEKEGRERVINIPSLEEDGDGENLELLSRMLDYCYKSDYEVNLKLGPSVFDNPTRLNHTSGIPGCPVAGFTL